jgi:hypothetical protein
VVYTKVKDWDGRPDLYLSMNSVKPTPILINIHGGGWKSGFKETQGGFSPYFKAGFSVAKWNSRMSGKPLSQMDFNLLIILRIYTK